MERKLLWVPALVLGLLAAWSPGAAARDGELYGRELMTPEERTAYREKMWRLKTEADRDRFRMNHHERMQERAQYDGVRLPERPWYGDRLPEWLREEESEGAPGGDPWPGDGLRRWPESRQEDRRDGLRRWPERASAEGSWPDDGLRRWPDQKAEAQPELRSDPEEARSLLPGAGRVDVERNIRKWEPPQVLQR